MDMESIESLNLAVDLYPGTVVFVSHDREFVSSLATRVIELGGESSRGYTDLPRQLRGVPREPGHRLTAQSCLRQG